MVWIWNNFRNKSNSNLITSIWIRIVSTLQNETRRETKIYETWLKKTNKTCFFLSFLKSLLNIFFNFYPKEPPLPWRGSATQYIFAQMSTTASLWRKAFEMLNCLNLNFEACIHKHATTTAKKIPEENEFHDIKWYYMVASWHYFHVRWSHHQIALSRITNVAWSVCGM